ncbi:carbohydrate kinase family protein [Schumannella sp. 10F1B-5-1]|uniref:carbohydrate kinase family protein n=1 Tax=Schumannella sp. 10F1B-5-1 TaxID=2590780 RepID=UPI0011323688|nr:carbohydrate kinase family protein [Schumannella sp. 10F1B-5-1]TPW71497.1 carbohydrate kinase family protein [Schumannella sp. 10F1B-5-1]
MTRRVIAVGDVNHDILVSPHHSVRPSSDTPSTVRFRPGGSAANTAAWLASLGVGVDLVGAIGSADYDRYVAELEDAGVTPRLQREVGMTTGTIIIIVERGQDPTMFTERGANALLSPAAVTPELLAEAAAVHLSAYSFVDGFGVSGARDVIDRSTAAGVPVVVNPSSPDYMRDFGVEAFLEASRGASVIFPNLEEGELLTGESSPERMIAAFHDIAETVVLTLGAEGAMGQHRSGSPIVRVPAPSVRVVDPTGAGDAFAAGFLSTWIDDQRLEPAMQSAVQAAARAIMLIGGRPGV